MGDTHIGLQARLISQALRKLTGSISKSSTMVIFINQIRMKIGVMFGSPETTAGGNALKFYSSVRLDIRRIGAIKEKDEIIGNQTRVKVVKNKDYIEVKYEINDSKKASMFIDMFLNLNFIINKLEITKNSMNIEVGVK